MPFAFRVERGYGVTIYVSAMLRSVGDGEYRAAKRTTCFVLNDGSLRGCPDDQKTYMTLADDDEYRALLWGTIMCRKRIQASSAPGSKGKKNMRASKLNEKYLILIYDEANGVGQLRLCACRIYQQLCPRPRPCRCRCYRPQLCRRARTCAVYHCPPQPRRRRCCRWGSMPYSSSSMATSPSAYPNSLPSESSVSSPPSSSDVASTTTSAFEEHSKSDW